MKMCKCRGVVFIFREGIVAVCRDSLWPTVETSQSSAHKITRKTKMKVIGSGRNPSLAAFFFINRIESKISLRW